MATFNFSTITAAEAAAFTAEDVLEFTDISASEVGLSSTGSSTVLTVGTRSITLPVALASLVAGEGSVLSFEDSSFVAVGDNRSGVDFDQLGNDLTPEGLLSEVDTTGDDQLIGLGGNDTIDGGTGSDLIYGNQGNDSINGESQDADSTDTVYGGQGGDIVTYADAAGAVVIYGNLGNDTLTGGAENDTIYGGQGGDSIVDGEGSDLLVGGLGNDVIASGEGDDVVYGNLGDDTITSTAGEDIIFGGQGNDVISAGGDADADPDPILPNADSVIVYGNLGDDALTGGAGDDLLFGGQGADTLDGGEGGQNVLTGGLGNDVLVAEIGEDASDDIYDGGEGTDTLLIGGDFSTTGSIFRSIEAVAFTDALEGDVDLSGFANALSFTVGDVATATVAATDFADTITIESEVATSLTIDAGEGDDTIDASEAVGTFILTGGAGNDRIVLNEDNETFTVGFAFEEGATVADVAEANGLDTIVGLTAVGQLDLGAFDVADIVEVGSLSGASGDVGALAAGGIVAVTGSSSVRLYFVESSEAGDTISQLLASGDAVQFATLTGVAADFFEV